MKSAAWVTFLLLAVAAAGCDAQTETPSQARVSVTPDREAREPLNTGLIERILGMEGVEQDGQYKISVPQEGLSVSVDGFQITPPMGLTSWVVFASAPQGAIIMGDLVLQEDEIGLVQKALIDTGLTITGLHNHFVRDAPKAMFMHIHGIGPLEQLAQGVRSTLDRIEKVRQLKGLTEEPVGRVDTTLDPDSLDQIIGHSGNLNAGVYKITIGRPDVRLLVHNREVSSFMGFNTWMAFQGTPERAAVAGDFAMLEHEVAPVINALVENGIEVVAVHNHMVNEQPRIFFLHFWGVGSAEQLARGLKAGLLHTGI